MNELVQAILDDFKIHPFSEWRKSEYTSKMTPVPVCEYSHESLDYSILYLNHGEQLPRAAIKDLTCFFTEDQAKALGLRILQIKNEYEKELCAESFQLQMDRAMSIFPNVDLSKHEENLVDLMGREIFVLSKDQDAVVVSMMSGGSTSIFSYKDEGQKECVAKLYSGLIDAYEESKKDEAAQWIAR